MKSTLPLFRRSEMAFLIAVSLISVGLTSWFTTSRLLQNQSAAAQDVLGQRMQDSHTAKGLEGAPLLLKRVFLAAGVHQGIEFSICVCAFGLIIGLVGIYLRERENKDFAKQ